MLITPVNPRYRPAERAPAPLVGGQGDGLLLIGDQMRAEDGPDARGVAGALELDGAIDPVGVGAGERPVPPLRGGGGEDFRARDADAEREVGVEMKVDHAYQPGFRCFFGPWPNLLPGVRPSSRVRDKKRTGGEADAHRTIVADRSDSWSPTISSGVDERTPTWPRQGAKANAEQRRRPGVVEPGPSPFRPATISLRARLRSGPRTRGTRRRCSRTRSPGALGRPRAPGDRSARCPTRTMHSGRSPR